MPRVPVQIGRKSDAAQAPSDSIERLINGYLESVPQGKEPSPVYGTPGLQLFANLTATGYLRLLHVMADRLFAVVGTSLVELSSTGAVTQHGNVDAGLQMDADDDGSTLSMVNPQTGKIWLYSDANGLQEVTDPAALPASSVVWIDEYFLYSQQNSDVYFVSNLAQPTSFNALNFAAAYWRPGPIRRVMILEKSVFILKEHSIEAAYDTGDTETFVFAPRPDIHIPVGVAGQFCAVSTNQTIYFLADDLTVRRLDGITPTRISTFAMERLIRGAPELGVPGWSDPSQTVMTEHVWRGHLFIVLNNPDGCIVFDQATQLWHERATYGRPSWAWSFYAYAFGQHIFGDQLGYLATAQPNVYTDNGSPLVFDVTFPFIYQQDGAFITHRLNLVMDTGRAPLGLVPKVQIAYSKDGYTWGNWKERSLGQAGAYQQRINLQGCGRSRGVAPRVRISDPVPRALLSAYADVEALSG